MEEIIIIFVEGHGEHIFFKKLIKEIEKKLDKKIKDYEIENLKSIGRYKGKALRVFCIFFFEILQVIIDFIWD